ncbi:hypothetical protein ABT154_07955 [Streptomyces sp. NPDC001728]|uniref:hypothetical protein n=1 Tax=Streptomyces sp. NPDC001728 TaxID=3154396 RepID=UPI003326241C
MITREIQLTDRITGAPALENFTVATTEVDGEVLVRTDRVGLAATYLEPMRADCTIPVPAWQPGQRVGVAAIGTVVRSDSPDLEAGDLVQSMTGWSEHFGRWLGEGRLVYPETVVDGGIEDVPQAFLSLLGGSYRGNVSVRLS